MTIIRKGAAPVEDNEEQRGMREAHLSDAGGLTQFGAHVVTLQPGARSSDRHWHEADDEFLYMLEGAAVVMEEDGEHAIGPGDAACWPAGVATIRHAVRRRKPQSRAPGPSGQIIAGSNPAGGSTRLIRSQASARSAGSTHRAAASIATVSWAGSQ